MDDKKQYIKCDDIQDQNWKSISLKLTLHNYLIFRAVHTLPWGTLESEEIEVEVTEALGKVCSSQNVVFHKMLKKCTFSLVTLSSFIFLQGALVLDFVCRIKLEAAFVVTGVKVKAITHIICKKRQYMIH